jgi:protein tyrosine/serine phosphatase
MPNKLRYSLLCLIFTTFFNTTLQASTPVEKSSNWSTLFDKRYNFYKVSPFVFRSEQTSKELIPLLQQNKIQTVINLRTSNKDIKVLNNIDIHVIHIPIRTWAMSKEDLLQVMKAIKNTQQSNQNVLIHCYHGSDRTGASIAMYRIIFENWSTEAALNEMKHGGYGFHPIWTNIEKLFSAENIKWIQHELSNPS